jgi:hypothetical protein
MTIVLLSFSVFLYHQIQAILDPLMLTDAQVKQVMETLYKEMRQGLSNDPLQRKMTSLQMEKTYVRSLLDGTGTRVQLVDHL